MTTETLVAREAVGASTSLPRRLYDGVTGLMTVIVAVVGVLALVIALVTRFSANQQYTVFGHPVMIVLSGSMTPLIRTGDLVIDQQVTASTAASLHVGQIISFRDPADSSKVITHRIHAVNVVNGEVASYVTKGDANNAPDATPVPPKNLIGLFDHKIPRGGYVLNALHKPLVLGLLIASPLLWLLSGWLIAYGRKPEEDSG